MRSMPREYAFDGWFHITEMDHAQAPEVRGERPCANAKSGWPDD
jgi:hypothetical protein